MLGDYFAKNKQKNAVMVMNMVYCVSMVISDRFRSYMRLKEELEVSPFLKIGLSQKNPGF